MTALAAFLIALTGTVSAEFRIPGYELVYSYPAETTLEEPDLRRTSDVWPELFDAAQKTIDVEQFYVSPSTEAPVDTILDPSIEALSRAAKRGVRVRVLLERKFAHNSIAGIQRLVAIPNLELRFLDWGKVGATGKGIIHAKFLVVDSSAAYVGSANFDWRALDQIHELGLAIQEPAVAAQTQAVFDHDWAVAGSTDWATTAGAEPSPPLFDDARASYLVASPRRFNPDGVADSQAELLRLIGSAKRSLIVQTYDYLPLGFGRDAAPYRAIDDALRAAAARGVKVKLLVDRLNEDARHRGFLEDLARLKGVEIKFIEIPQASRGPIDYARVIHSKYMVVDDKLAWIGTSNWAGGYLDDSRNLEVVVKDPLLAERVRKIHEHLWKSTYAVALVPPKPDPKSAASSPAH